MDYLGGCELTKVTLQRALALVYLIAFLVAVNQFRALLGEHGLLPVPQFVKQVRFGEAPSLFYFFPYDTAFAACAWLGVGLSLLALLGIPERYGTVPSVVVWSLLYVLYLSFVNVGQTFYGFGWESLLLEAGFFAIFLGGAGRSPPALTIWMFRWLLFRVMLGAGLIKLRGDPCWRDLTCLFYHFETQPMPNPLSWYFHQLPHAVLKGGVLFNHFVELIVPFGLLAPQPFARIAGLFTFAFHGMLMISGNFAWLSFLTMLLALSTFDDRFLGALLRLHPATAAPMETWLGTTVMVLALAVAVMSYYPLRNLFSRYQAMNTSYNPFHLVGSYGAFGSITRPRYEVIVEGTSDAHITAAAVWREYEFKGKPGDIHHLPPVIAPYHLRLGWLLWFAGFSSFQEHPWFLYLLAKLLANDAPTLALLRTNPFPDQPPRFIRASLYEYHFTTPAERAATGAWWKRTYVHRYFPPVSLDDADFRGLLEAQGWELPVMPELASQKP
ncbi:MAG: lipase maturation factor family protein [Kiritimatiellaeota bacterium]|nr:lipase maturation factor family protein [Kiritimatiellota bacterium]